MSAQGQEQARRAAAARAAVDEHVAAALRHLAVLGDVRKTFTDSPSPKAQMEAEVLRRAIQSARSHLVGTRGVLASVEETVAKAQGWHDQYKTISGT